jgi:membrane protease subunit (stomatin/prohibitin family)
MRRMTGCALAFSAILSSPGCALVENIVGVPDDNRSQSGTPQSGTLQSGTSNSQSGTPQSGTLGAFCEECGTKGEGSFCADCGTKRDTASVEEDTAKRCNKCDVKLEGESAFCANCGNKVGN